MAQLREIKAKIQYNNRLELTQLIDFVATINYQSCTIVVNTDQSYRTI